MLKYFIMFLLVPAFFCSPKSPSPLLRIMLLAERFSEEPQTPATSPVDNEGRASSYFGSVLPRASEKPKKIRCRLIRLLSFAAQSWGFLQLTTCFCGFTSKYVPIPSKGCFLVGFKYLKACKQHPFATPGICILIWDLTL